MRLAFLLRAGLPRVAAFLFPVDFFLRLILLVARCESLSLHLSSAQNPRHFSVHASPRMRFLPSS